MIIRDRASRVRPFASLFQPFRQVNDRVRVSVAPVAPASASRYVPSFTIGAGSRGATPSARDAHTAEKAAGIVAQSIVYSQPRVVPSHPEPAVRARGGGSVGPTSGRTSPYDRCIYVSSQHKPPKPTTNIVNDANWLGTCRHT